MGTGGPLSTGGVLRRVAIGLGALLVIVVAAWLLGVVGAPSVAGVENAFGPVNQSTTVIETDLVVDNPNPVGVRLGGLTIDYAVEMNGIRMAEGHRRGVDIEPGTSTVHFRSLMDNGKLPAWWVSHVKNGERTELVVDAAVRSSLLGRTFEPQVTRTVETDIIGAFNSDEDRPLEAGKEPVVQDPVLWLNETTGQWGAVDNETTEIQTTFTLYNPKAYPITITELAYEIRMNNVTMGTGTTEQTTTIAPGETATLEATTVMRNENLDEWWVTHLENDQVTRLEVDLEIRIDLSAAGAGSVTIPLDTFERTIETDIFGNKSSSADGSGDGDGSDGNPAGTSDGTGDGESSTSSPTATPTDTPSPTPSPTPTETDDGILDRDEP